jgi:hypothetical protein
MCVVCYNPAIIVGELTIVGGPFVAVTARRLADRFRNRAESAPAQSRPVRTHQRDTAAAAAPAAAAIHAVG